MAIGGTPMAIGKTPMQIGKTPTRRNGKTPMQIGKKEMGIGVAKRIGLTLISVGPMQMGTSVGAKEPGKRTPRPREKAPQSTSAEVTQTSSHGGGTWTSSARVSRVLQPNRRANRLPNRRNLPDRKVFLRQLFVFSVFPNDRFIFCLRRGFCHVGFFFVSTMRGAGS